MIDLNCPKCHTHLSLDMGFRGGVCRCFHCSAMITVPSDEQDAPRELRVHRRTDRPEEPQRRAAPWPKGADDTTIRLMSDTSKLNDTTVLRTDDGFELEITEVELETIPVAPRRTPGAPVRYPARRPTRRPTRRPVRQTPSNGMMPMVIIVILAGFLLILGVVASQRASRESAATEASSTFSPSTYPTASDLTLDDYRSAVPAADDHFLIIQMNKGHSLKQARGEWQDAVARQSR